MAVAPASHLVFSSAVAQLGYASGYAGLIAYGRLAADSTLNAGDVLTPSGIEAMSGVDDNVCREPSIDPATDFRADFLQVSSWVASFTKNEPGFERIASPVLLVQGSVDTTVPQIATELLCAELGSSGTNATRWLYDGLEHVGTAAESRVDRHHWLLDRMAGATATAPRAGGAVGQRSC